jgi:hypothetical protein
MLAPQDLKDWPTGAGELVLRLQDDTLVSACQGAGSRPDATTEDLGIVGPCQSLLSRNRVPAMPAQHLRLGVIDKGRELALVPEVHPVRKALPDVPCLSGSWRCLQDDQDKDQGLVGILGAGLHPLEIPEGGRK